MSNLLTAQEVEQLTGYRKPALQIAWLVKNGVPHHVNRLGRPVVPANYMEKSTVGAYELGAVR